MKIKTSELTGPALDWAVAKQVNFPLPEMPFAIYDWFKAHGPKYSSDWAQGGPIIEREGINTYQMQDGTWQAILDYGMSDEAIYHGPTPLIAAMRCYCCSRLGDVVDIPEELCQQQKS